VAGYPKVLRVLPVLRVFLGSPAKRVSKVKLVFRGSRVRPAFRVSKVKPGYRDLQVFLGMMVFLGFRVRQVFKELPV